MPSRRRSADLTVHEQIKTSSFVTTRRRFIQQPQSESLCTGRSCTTSRGFKERVRASFCPPAFCPRRVLVSRALALEAHCKAWACSDDKGKDEERGRPRFITIQSGVCCKIEIGRQSNFSYMQHKDVGRRALLESRHLPGPRYVDHGCALRLLLQPCFVAGSHYAYSRVCRHGPRFFRVPVFVPEYLKLYHVVLQFYSTYNNIN